METKKYKNMVLQKAINKGRKLVPKDKKNDWDNFILKLKLKYINNINALDYLVEVVDLMEKIDIGCREGQEMWQILKKEKAPFKYKKIIGEFSKFGDEYLDYYEKIFDEKE